MPNIATKFYISTMTGAPSMTNSYGELTNLLDAVLINGFNTKTVSSITRTGTTCTVTTSTTHGYIVDQVLVISGANETEYNTELRIVSVPTATTFTFTITGTPNTPATGTISCKVAPLNWSTVFTTTNQRIYRSNNSSSAKNCLKIDDSQPSNYTAGYAVAARVGMAQSYGDINTALGAQAPYDYTNPTKNFTLTGTGGTAFNGWWKWYHARALGASTGNANGDNNTIDSNARQWVVVGDDRGFYLFNTLYGSGNTYGMVCNGFTDINSYKSGDIYNTLLIGSENYQNVSTTWSGSSNPSLKGYQFTDITPNVTTANYIGKTLLRDHTGLGNHVGAGFRTIQMSLTSNISSGYTSGINWPNYVDYSLVIHPFYVAQSDGNLRGTSPGIYWVLNNMSSGGYSDLQIIDSVSGYTGRKFINLKLMSGTTNDPNSNVMVDITGPWW